MVVTLVGTMGCKPVIYGTLILGVLLFIGGIALIVTGVFNSLIEKKIKGEFTLTESSRMFKNWKNPPLPVYMQFFFFNVTNPNEFIKGEAKPRLTHMGPYTYREYRPKENVTFVEGEAKVSAYTPKYFVFEREMSVGDPDVDQVTSVNIPAVAVMNKLKDVSFWTKSAISIYMTTIGTTMFMTNTVNELLWGFKDPLLSRLKTFKPEVEEYFGLMLNKNGSNDGEFVYHTGKKNYLDYGRIDTWMGQKIMTYWATNQSNMINGSDGSAFHPFLNKDERLRVFTPDLCRSIYMQFEKEVSVRGIPAYRFTPPRDVLANATNNPDNEGFCLDKNNCLDDGVLHVGVCRKGAPVVVSFPHFYLGAQKYIDAIEGISPVHEEHQTYLDLNPTTGLPVRASKKAQINIKLDRVSSFPMTEKLNGIIFPIMFLNESVVIDEPSAQKLHKLLFVVSMAPYFPLILVALGVILLMIGGLLLYRSKQKKGSEKIYSPVNPKEEDPAEKNGTFMGMTPVEKS